MRCYSNLLKKLRAIEIAEEIGNKKKAASKINVDPALIMRWVNDKENQSVRKKTSKFNTRK